MIIDVLMGIGVSIFAIFLLALLLTDRFTNKKG